MAAGLDAARGRINRLEWENATPAHRNHELLEHLGRLRDQTGGG